MHSRPIRLLVVSPQPVHNEGCSLRLVAAAPDIALTVAYCSLPEPKLWRGPEYLTKQLFTNALPEGYEWIGIPNTAHRPRLDRFWGLWNPRIVSLIRRGAYDCCIVYGYGYASCWMAMAAARWVGTPLVLTTDATTLESVSGSRWRLLCKRMLLPWIYRSADLVMAPSTATVRFLVGLGVPSSRVVCTPYVVDNDNIRRIADATDRAAIRARWSIPYDAVVAVFCAKFLERKRPLDLIRAFAEANVERSYLVMVGDGPLRRDVERCIGELGIADRVRLLGLVPYDELPTVYAASDLLVHPASHEPWGLPINEAMVCGIPAIVTDRVGAGADLVIAGSTGYVYPNGDVAALTTLLRGVLSRPAELQRMGRQAQERMRSWSPRDNASALVTAVRAVIHGSGRGGPSSTS